VQPPPRNDTPSTTTTTVPPPDDRSGEQVVADRVVTAAEGDEVVVAPPPGLGEGESSVVEVLVSTDEGEVSIFLEQSAGESASSIRVTSMPADDANVDARGFHLLGMVFEVDVEGDAQESGGVVCLPYTDAALAAAGLTEDDLELFHYRADGTREVVTTSIDTVNNRICGQVDSFSPFAAGALATDRLAGGTAAWTAAKISRETFDPGVPVAYVVARGPDGLGAGTAAAKAGGPVLFVERDFLPSATRIELARLQPGRVVVVGGSSVVSDAVVAAVGGERVAGADRYATAAALAETFGTAEVVYVASGRSAADALVAGAAAGAAGAPLLLVEPDAVPDATRAALDALQPTRIVVVGGSAAVSDEVVAALGAERLAGADRYATSAAVAASVGRTNLFVTRGDDPVDAAPGIPAAVVANAVIVLVRPDGIPASVAEVLAALDPTAITVLGGTAAVSTPTEVDLAAFLD
jgi:putative cell wall-binding protein